MAPDNPVPWMNPGTSFGEVILNSQQSADSGPACERHCRSSRVNVELAQDRSDVGADGVRRDVQRRPNLVAGQSFHQAAQHLELSLGQVRNGISLGCGPPTFLRLGDQELGQQGSWHMDLPASGPPDRDEQCLDGTLLGHPAQDSHTHGLTDPIVICRIGNDYYPEVGPSVPSPAAYQ